MAPSDHHHTAATAPLIRHTDADDQEDEEDGILEHHEREEEEERYSRDNSQSGHSSLGHAIAARKRNNLVDGAGTRFVWVLTFSAGISGLLFGYDTGVISSTLICIKSSLSNRPLTTMDKSLITSCTSFFALFASPVAGVLADKLGRRSVILAADILFVIGALMQAFASSVPLMIAGRSVIGAAVGSASLVTPMYIAELAPAQLRGRLVTVSTLMITAGQVVAYVVGWLLSESPAGWRWMVGIACAPAVVQCVLMVFMPETPRWLVKIGRRERAREVLDKVYGDDGVGRAIAKTVLRDIEAEILAEEQVSMAADSAGPNSEGKASWFANLASTMDELLRGPGNRRALAIACLLQGLQQLCGFNSLMYFSSTIFALLGFTSPTLTSLSIAVTNLIFTLVAFLLIDRLGRRRILLFTVPCMSISLLICAWAFSRIDYTRGSDSSQRHFLSLRTDTESIFSASRIPALTVLFSLILYVSSYASGLGVIPWHQSELFSLRVRSLGSSISTATNWGCNTIVGLTFLPLMNGLGGDVTFVLYAIVCAVGVGLIWACFPELTGLELEEVGRLLERGWGVKESLGLWALRKRERDLERSRGRRGRRAS